MGKQSTRSGSNPGISVLPAYPQMLSQPILGRKNIRSGPPLSALRRSLRLHPNLSQEIATQHPISSAPYIQANDDNKSSKAANSNNNSSVKQIRSLDDAAITQGNPMETAPRYDPVIHEVIEVEDEDEVHDDSAQVNGSGSDGKRLQNGFVDGDLIHQGVRWNLRQAQACMWGSSNVDGKSKTSGYYNDEEAARAHDVGALELWGSLTHPNFTLVDNEKGIEEIESLPKPEYKLNINRRTRGPTKGASMFRGVSRNTVTMKWQARLGKRKGERSVYLGTFASEEEAARAYDVAAIRLKGTAAIINFNLSNYNVEEILESDKIPIGDRASKWIKNTPVEEIIRWRSRMNPKETDRPWENPVVTGSSSQPSVGAPPFGEKYPINVDVDEGLFKTLPDEDDCFVPVMARNTNFSFLKDIEVPPSQMDPNSFYYGPAGPDGGSLFAEHDTGIQEFALQDPVEILPGASKTLANPECQSPRIPTSCLTGAGAGINSQGDHKPMIARVRSNRIYVGEYLRELFPDGDIPEVDWDKILMSEGFKENPISGASTHFLHNPSSNAAGFSDNSSSQEQPNGPGVFSQHGSLGNDESSTAAVALENSRVMAANSNASGRQGNGQTNPLDGFGSFLPVTPEEFHDFGLYAGWLNEFSKNPGHPDDEQ